MCIRDIRVDHGPHLVLGHQAAEVGGGTQGPPIHLGETEGCLLYTSEAADDLLCVDLGGRRNIKKKKILQQ